MNFMYWMQIEKDVVVLNVEEKDGKVVPGKLTVLPMGVFRKLYKNEEK